jgi:predicted RNase H-like HicB family nuclease/DNA-binding XRE family transcriptional regulator
VGQAKKQERKIWLFARQSGEGGPKRQASMKYHFKAHKEKALYWAECLELSGCLTQGSSLAEVQENARDAVNLYLDEPEDSKISFPLPNKAYDSKKGVFIAEVDPQIAFAVLLRQVRLAQGITQKMAAKKLGIENLYSYQRLEHRGNPTLKTIQKVKVAFPDFPIEYVL